MPREWDHPCWSFEMGSVLLPQRPQSSYFARVACHNFLPLEGGVIFWQQIWGVKWLTSPSPPPSLSRLPQKLRLIPQGGRSQHTGHHLDLQPVTNLQLRLGDVILVWPCRVPGSSHSAARFTTFHMMHVHNFEQSKLNFQSQKESFKYLSPGPAMQQQQPVTWTSDISSWPRPVPSMPPAYAYIHTDPAKDGSWLSGPGLGQVVSTAQASYLPLGKTGLTLTTNATPTRDSPLSPQVPRILRQSCLQPGMIKSSWI